MPSRPTRKKTSRSKSKPRKRPRRAAAARKKIAVARRPIQQARQELNIIVDLIPRANSNRPGTPLHASKITIHNTDNAEPGADARAHATYQKGGDAQRRKVSWHFTVDDRNIYQSLPVDEVGWHAGSHDGNSTSVGIEICENQGIDQAAANRKTAELTALLLHELHIDLDGNVVQHNSWSGKNCPALLRTPPSGWKNFLRAVEQLNRELDAGYYENEHRAPVHLVDFDQGIGVQRNILSTEFGGGSETGMPSAYGGIINPDQPQASLPARVSMTKRRIEVKNPANGHSVTCLVNDVGPWNIHDAYWDLGGRPAAEAQHQNNILAENGHIPTNSAGLDLTPAALLALGVSGAVNTRQVRVDWNFV